MFDNAEELLRRIRIPEDSLTEFKEITFRGDRVDGPGPSRFTRRWPSPGAT
ncbi:MAG: hypothetical protein GY856_25440 [bacterium]|nr:hypothetical protein [bacterium]